MDSPTAHHLRQSLARLALAAWPTPFLMLLVARAAFATAAQGGLTLNGFAKVGCIGVLLLTLLCAEWTLLAHHLAGRAAMPPPPARTGLPHASLLLPIGVLAVLVGLLHLPQSRLSLLASAFVAIPAPAVALAVGGVALTSALAAAILLCGITMERAAIVRPDSFARGPSAAVLRIIGHHRAGGPALLAGLGSLGAAAFAGSFFEPVLLNLSQRRAGFYGAGTDALETALLAGLPVLLLSIQLFRVAMAAGAALHGGEAA